MANFQHLPVEILIKIIGYIANDQTSCLASLSAVSRTLRSVFQPVLFQKWIHELDYPFETQEGYSLYQPVLVKDRILRSRRLRSFVDTLEERPALASHLHTFELLPVTWNTRHRIVSRFDVEELSFCIENVGRNIERVLTQADNLKTLTISYPLSSTFLNITIPSLEVLEVHTWFCRLMGHNMDWREEELYVPITHKTNISFLNILFQSSILKVLNLKAYMIVKTYERTPQLPMVPTLKEILIETKSMNTTTVCWLIESAPSLERFSLKVLAQEHENVLRFKNSRTLTYPNPTTIISTLTDYSKLIRHLILRYPHDRWQEQQVLPNITLESFYQLQHLDIDEYIILGWRPCRHIPASEGGVEPTTPEKLSSLLPSSLEVLELRLDVLYDIRYGVGHAFQIVSGLLQRQNHLPNFDRLIFHFPFVYCHDCERHQENAARAAPPTSPLVPVYGVDLTEAAQIKLLMSSQESNFVVDYRENPIHWIGAADGNY